MMMDVTTINELHREKDDVSETLTTAQSQAPSCDRPKFLTICPFCRVWYKSYRTLLNKPTRCQSCYTEFFASEALDKVATSGKETCQKTLSTAEKRASSQNQIVRSNLVVSTPKNQLQPQNSQPETVPLSCRPSFCTMCPFCEHKYRCQRKYINKRLTCKCKKRFIAAEVNISSLQQKKVPSKNPGTHFSGKESSPGLKCAVSVGEKRQRHEYGESCNAVNRSSVVDNSRRCSNGNGDGREEFESRKQAHEVDGSKDPMSITTNPNQKMDRNQDAQVGAAVENSGNLEVDKYFEHVIDRDVGNNRRGFNDNGDAGRQLHEVDRSEETLPNVINTNQKLNENQDDLESSGNLEVDKIFGSCDSGSGGAVQPKISEFAGLKFNNFDRRREEANFGPWQAWALYDTVDGMPRQYALIRKVSTPSFGIRITYLEPDPDDEKEIQWFEEELPVSAGKFRLGKNQNTKDRSMFSHVIWCNEGSKKGHFTVSPKQGQTWALFKNWDINWSSEPDSHRKFEYEFVKILSDYDDEAGVSVAFLYKAKGFASVFFRMGTGDADVFHILPHSLYRFSHRIPSFKMKRVDIKGVPKDAYELDQDALPDNIEEKIIPSHLYAEPKPEALAFPNKGKVFQTGQIWSYYSGNDILPLYYCRIQKITLIQAIEQEAVFKLHVGRLKATSFPENVIQWEHKRMPVGCGTFVVRKISEVLTADDVSHQIVPQRSVDGDEYTILPKIGEVWAIYRLWTSHKEFKDVGCCDYDIVEVLDDTLDYKVLALELALFYNEDEEKKTFFRGAESRHPDCDDEDGSEVIFTIPKLKMLRFSHPIPASRVTKEINGDMKELIEVDSRALPTNVRSGDH